jgi:uncharacterized membrane protein YphA (DoxX/SURF4 family)
VKPLSLLVRLPLAALFVIAGVLKLGDPTQFAIDVHNYMLLPDLAPYLAVLLPYVEIGAGLGLLLLPRAWRQASALVILGLMLMFTVAVGSALQRHLNVDCGCFAKGSGPVTPLTAQRDVGLIALAALAVWLEREPRRAAVA